MKPSHSLPRALRIAVTADLHYGPRHADGNVCTEALARHLSEHPPDVLLLAGDIGVDTDWTRCLELFAPLDCPKALVPGNHDIWVRCDDYRGDSLRLYRDWLPRLAERQGFHYLDHKPLLLPEADLAIVGSINWYDYSWSIERLKTMSESWEYALTHKRFSRGQHNDRNFVRWPLDDAGFTAEVVTTLTIHLDEALKHASKTLVVTHHPPFRAIDYPRPEPATFDALLWAAFSGNDRLERILAERAGRIAAAFCGHTHFAIEGQHHGIPGWNIGGDYHFKRLLTYHWPSGVVESIEFHTEVVTRRKRRLYRGTA